MGGKVRGGTSISTIFKQPSAMFVCYTGSPDSILGNLRKTVEDGDGNVGKTIKLITQDKERT